MPCDRNPLLKQTHCKQVARFSWGKSAKEAMNRILAIHLGFVADIPWPMARGRSAPKRFFVKTSHTTQSKKEKQDNGPESVQKRFMVWFPLLSTFS